MHAKVSLRILTLLGLTLVCAWTLRGDIPAVLVAPANQELALTLTAKGVQIYECRAVAGETGKYEWAFKAPAADLYDARGNVVGRHYGGPTWELNEGGKVVGRLKAKAGSPDGQSIPWLMLEGFDRSGPGVLGRTLSIQRVDTVGGEAPTEPADATKVGQLRRVDYTATYRFYVAKP